MNVNVGDFYVMVPQSRTSGGGISSGGATSSGGCTWVAVPIAKSEPRLAKVTTMPVGGAGMGAVQYVAVAADGGIVGSGASISVVMPYIDGIN